MIIKALELETVCGISSALPKNNLPEIALAGRSNVGKSSLINGLINRKAFAKTSSTPGKTKTLNFYRVNDSFYLVDLPGYGYTKISQEESKKWAGMINNYLENSKNLKYIFQLIDIRHKPSVQDREMYNWIVENDFVPVIICTKSDKIGKTKIRDNVNVIKDSLGLTDSSYLYTYSSLSKDGREDIWSFIEDKVLI